MCVCNALKVKIFTQIGLSNGEKCNLCLNQFCLVALQIDILRFSESNALSIGRYLVNYSEMVTAVKKWYQCKRSSLIVRGACSFLVVDSLTLALQV